MTSSLQYKFKSQLKYAALHFDGDSISLADVKERIMTEKRMQKANDYDLEVTNANTGECKIFLNFSVTLDLILFIFTF